MNLFGKNKDLSQVPPAPLRRPEKLEQMAHSHAEEEEDDDDQYTYEIPPSEGKKMMPAKPQEAEEDMYLDCPSIRRFSEPGNVLQQSKPRTFLSKPGVDDGGDEEVSKFEALEKALKKGMMKPSLPPPLLPPPPPLSARRVSLPVLGPSGFQANAAMIRDSLLALKDVKVIKHWPFPFMNSSLVSTGRNRQQEDPEDAIYIECEPSPASAPCRALACPTPAPPARPVKQSKPKICTPGPQQGPAGTSPAAGGCLKSGYLPEDSVLQNEAWYAGSCGRHAAEAALLRFNKDSAYMVRQSSGQGWNQPFTLVVLYKNHVYNIPIRYLESSHQYVLGKGGKKREELFDSVSSIIQNYAERPLLLVDGSTSSKEQTCLLFPVKP